MSKDMTISKFYCTKCGHEGIPVHRRTSRVKEPGHLKKLYCIYCNKEVNHAEVRGFGEYTIDDFLLEFNNSNFDEDGNRKQSWKSFISKIKRGDN